MKGYNGWKNYETWNVALWIGNDEGLYLMAKESRDYASFVDSLREVYGECADAGRSLGKPGAFQTNDRVSWTDSALDTGSLDEMIAEL